MKYTMYYLTVEDTNKIFENELICDLEGYDYIMITTETPEENNPDEDEVITTVAGIRGDVSEDLLYSCDTVQIYQLRDAAYRIDEE